MNFDRVLAKLVKNVHHRLVLEMNKLISQIRQLKVAGPGVLATVLWGAEVRVAVCVHACKIV